MDEINETTKLCGQQIPSTVNETRLDENPPPYTPYQQTFQPPRGGFEGVPSSYHYNQPMPPPSSVTNTSTVVVNQPHPSQIVIVSPAPYSNMVPAVLTCLFCCWIIGIGAIIASAISQSQSAEMRYEEARNSAKISKVLTFITLSIGICGYITIIILATTYTK